MLCLAESKDRHLPLLKAYRIRPDRSLDLVPAASTRAWMDASYQRNAYRCLPLLIANQAGWFVQNPHELRATWSGGRTRAAVRIEYLQDGAPCECPSHEGLVLSNFGEGIITWHIPYLFRTPPGYNLLARGPANWPKDAAAPLEGLVETDWAVATFTMNWKLTRPKYPVTFALGEPICMLVPQRRGELESFQPQVLDLEAEPALQQAHSAWNESRKQFLLGKYLFGPSARSNGQPDWQGEYVRGTLPDGAAAPDHQARLHLRPFEAVTAAPAPPTGEQ
jgi:hypothetical protein